jgi:hypothetical protein
MAAVRAACSLLGVLLLSAVLVADDRTVLVDPGVNFASFKTFSMAAGTFSTKRSELSTPIAARALADAIRLGLAGAGLQEVAANGDLLVEHSVKTVDFNIGPFGVARPVAESGTRRGRPNEPSDGHVDFTDGTLVIDLKAGSPRALVWRGVYNDLESSGGALVADLPLHATRLLSAYPRKRK